MISNIFTKETVLLAVPRLPSGSQFRLYTGTTGDSVVQNDEGTFPMVFVLRQVGELAILESVDITAETYKATIISDTEPSINSQWWFSKDGGSSKERVKILKKETGQFGYFYVIYFQVQN